MESEDKRKCFTFMWIIENISYSWQETSMAIKSPKFTIGEIQDSRFQLSLFPRGSMESYENYIAFYLIREGGCRDLKLDCELSFLSMDNVVLASTTYDKMSFSAGSREFKERKDIFFYNKSSYLSQDKLRARCKIWKSDEGMTQDVQCFARTRICIERTSFVWNIKNFSSILPKERCSTQIKSVLDNDVLITFDLFIKNGNYEEEPIKLQLVSNNEKVKYFVLHLTALNEMIRNQSVFHNANHVKFLTLPFSKKKLLANKNLCLPNDVLSFRGECVYSTGKILKEVERVIYGTESCPIRQEDNPFLDERDSLSTSKRTLHENLISLFHDNIHSDIKLKTSSEIYFAHKSILSARSPVFRAMFSNNMKEKCSDCVDIEDLDSDTVYRMLHYVYTAEIKDIEFEAAYELYRAADKYEILTLRDQCSAYIRCNFSPSNVCEALVLADRHEDRDLKVAAQDFIYEHDVVNTGKWAQLLGSHLKLAADTMFYQIQKTKDKCIPPPPRFGSNTVTKKFLSQVCASRPYEISFTDAIASSPESDGDIAGPSFLHPVSDDSIGGLSNISPESDDSMEGTSASSVAMQRNRRMMRRDVRSLARSYSGFNSHIPNAVYDFPSLDSFASIFGNSVARPSWLPSESVSNVSWNYHPSESDSSSGSSQQPGIGRLLRNLHRFNTRREEQSRR